MIHYSENDWPLTELELSDNNLEWVRESRVDKHLVWTEEFANYIKSKNPVLKVEVKGSLIFQPLPRKDFLPYLEKSISVFDIVPSIEENPLGPYNERSCISFLSGINQVRQLFLNNGGVPPLFILKSKRRIINSHSRVYLRYRTELESLGVIKVVPWYFNLYDLILSSKFVVCAIGSSPALIAREYKIPVAFHYQGQHKLADPIVDYGIPRTSHPQELYDLIQRALINQGDGGN
jgi:polysaccharide biosynthesis PFTS motif protein